MRHHTTLIVESDGDKLAIHAIGLTEDGDTVDQKFAAFMVGAAKAELARQEKADADVSADTELPSDSEGDGPGEAGEAEGGVPANPTDTDGPKLRLAQPSGGEDVEGSGA